MRMFKVSETKYINLDNAVSIQRGEYSISIYFVGTDDNYRTLRNTDDLWNRLVKAMEVDKNEN